MCGKIGISARSCMASLSNSSFKSAKLASVVMPFNLRAIDDTNGDNDVFFMTSWIPSIKSKKLIDRIFKPGFVLTQGLAKPIRLRKLQAEIRDGIHLLLQRGTSRDKICHTRARKSRFGPRTSTPQSPYNVGNCCQFKIQMLRARLISAFLSSMVFAVTSATAPAAALGFALALFFAFALGAGVCPAMDVVQNKEKSLYKGGTSRPI